DRHALAGRSAVRRAGAGARRQPERLARGDGAPAPAAGRPRRARAWPGQRRLARCPGWSGTLPDEAARGDPRDHRRGRYDRAGAGHRGPGRTRSLAAVRGLPRTQRRHCLHRAGMGMTPSGATSTDRRAPPVLASGARGPNGSRKMLRHAAMLALPLALATLPPALAAEDSWSDLREALFEDRPISEAPGVIALEAPYRAQDAAIVPITIVAEQPQSPERYIKSITLVIDENPAPVAAVFHLTPESGLATLATRVR